MAGRCQGVFPQMGLHTGMGGFALEAHVDLQRREEFLWRSHDGVAGNVTAQVAAGKEVHIVQNAAFSHWTRTPHAFFRRLEQ
ncbi:hypothetical protein D3C75_1193410 [compost metagenome]